MNEIDMTLSQKILLVVIAFAFYAVVSWLAKGQQSKKPKSNQSVKVDDSAGKLTNPNYGAYIQTSNVYYN